MRRPEKPSAERITPAMIRALNPARKPALRLRAHTSPTMAADIEKASDCPVTIARHNDAFASDVDKNVIAGIRYRFRTAGSHPAVEEKPLHLLVENTRIDVVPPRQCKTRRIHLLQCIHSTRQVLIRCSK